MILLLLLFLKKFAFLLRFCKILYILYIILYLIFFFFSIIIDIAYTIVCYIYIFIFPIHLKSLIMHMCKK